MLIQGSTPYAGGSQYLKECVALAKESVVEGHDFKLERLLEIS